MKGQIQIAGETVEYTSRRSFNSAVAANCFREGIEYVNDSALTVVAINEEDGLFTVYMFDEDLY